MAHDNKGVSKEEAIRRGWQDLTQGVEEPKAAKAKAAAQQDRGKPAQVTPAEKQAARRHPEDVPPPGNMGPDEGPSA